jgi:hypothetical protein
MADPHDALHLLSGSRQQNGQRHHTKIREPVALIGLELLGRPDETALTDNRPKFV